MGRVARKMVEEFFPVKPGEHVVVTADSRADWRTVQATVRAIYAIGAVPTLVLRPSSEESYESDPPPPVISAVQAADAWIDFGESELLYGTAWKKAMAAGVRYWAMVSPVDMVRDMVAGINYVVLDKLANELVELSNRASEIRITSEVGTDLRVKVDPEGSIGHVLKGGKKTGIRFEGDGPTQIPPGQCVFGHVPEGVDGTLVFDGFVSPPAEIGVLREPVSLDISGGKITKIEGGREARTFENWLARWNHAGMYRIGHCTYGFNPGVKKCRGNIPYDERVFGCMEFGIGVPWEGAPAHTDGGLLRPSVWADDVQLEKDGKYVHRNLVELCRQLKVAGY
jgi:leucyl aminopeptidase (aminopeptidase T)